METAIGILALLLLQTLLCWGAYTYGRYRTCNLIEEMFHDAGEMAAMERVIANEQKRLGRL